MGRDYEPNQAALIRRSGGKDVRIPCIVIDGTATHYRVQVPGEDETRWINNGDLDLGEVVRLKLDDVLEVLERHRDGK